MFSFCKRKTKVSFNLTIICFLLKKGEILFIFSITSDKKRRERKCEMQDAIETQRKEKKRKKSFEKGNYIKLLLNFFIYILCIYVVSFTE